MNRQRILYGASFGVFLLFLILYLLTANQLFSFDAVTNAIACEANEPARWFHSNHLFYPFAGVLWFKLERLLGYRGYAIYSLARFNTLLMSSAMGITAYLMFKRTNRWNSLAIPVFLGTTFAVWNYAVDGRAVGASVFFTVCVIAALFLINEKAQIKEKDVIILGAFSLLTILFHGIAVFHVVPVAVWIWWRSKQSRLAFLYCGVIGGALAVITTGIYFFFTHPVSEMSFVRWTIGYAGFEAVPKSGFWVNSFSGLIAGPWIGWERALLTPVPGLYQKILISMLAVSILLFFLYSFSRIKNVSSSLRPVVLVLIAWGVVVNLFLLFWSPGQEGFRLHVLVPWTIAAGICLADMKFIGWIFGTLAAIFFAINFNFGIYPAAFIQNNIGFQTLTYARTLMKPGDMILSGESGALPEVEVLLPYFFRDIAGGSVYGRLYSRHERSMAPLFENLFKWQGRGAAIYFVDDIFDVKVQTDIEAACGLGAGDISKFLGRVEVKKAYEMPNGHRLFQVQLRK